MAMNAVRKFFVGLGGGLIIIFGLVLIPTPAPEGWLIVFGGIALLSTEFSFAKKLMMRAKAIRLKLNSWMRRQPVYIQTSLNILGIVALVGTIGLVVWMVVLLFV